MRNWLADALRYEVRSEMDATKAELLHCPDLLH